MAKQKRILVVEDEPHILKLVSFILTSNGYEVIEAYIGAEGVEKARKEKPDLVVLDVMMPNMDGFEVAKTLTSDMATKDIPILMLSSKAQFEDKMKGIDSGATDYITKPFDKEELLQKVRECLEEA
ncbi:response regulator [Candidatus Woesearchaeota archaeon]|nr:response regulator [Candidatus Woesearchaeota archaeon]